MKSWRLATGAICLAARVIWVSRGIPESAYSLPAYHIDKINFFSTGNTYTKLM
jgi:hypothetical protein